MHESANEDVWLVVRRAVRSTVYYVGATHDAGVAHLVERHLAKVEVAGSSPVARSTNDNRSKSIAPVIYVAT